MKIDSPISANYYKIIVHVQYKNKPLKRNFHIYGI